MLPVQHTPIRAKTDLAAPSLATRLFANTGGLERSCGDTLLASDAWPGPRAEAFVAGLQPSRMPLARPL